jgi:hypothetical protein
MRTTLPGTFFVLTSLVALSIATPADACSFALQYGGKMERSQRAISNVDRVKLADLLLTVRDSAAKQGPVVIYGFADERDSDPSGLGRHRAESVSGYLQHLGVAPERIHIETRIWRITSPVPVEARNQIEVEFEPACGPAGCENPCDAAASSDLK